MKQSIQGFLKRVRIALLNSQFLEMLRRLWFCLPFAWRQNLVAAYGKREQRYYLDFPLNMRGVAFTGQELRLVLQQHMPCDMSFTIFYGSPDYPAGSGTYIKNQDTSGHFEIITEQGACQGMMTWLFPNTTNQAATYSRAFAH